jgi:hypothetical protein
MELLVRMVFQLPTFFILGYFLGYVFAHMSLLIRSGTWRDKH